MSKTSFILHVDSLKILDELTNEQKGILFDAIYRYQLGQEPDLDFAMRLAFVSFKNQFIRDKEKYSEFSKKQSGNGSKGGRPKKNPEEPKKPNAFFENPKNPTQPKKAYSDSDSVNVSDNDNVSVNVNDNVSVIVSKGNFKKFQKPTHLEISNYCYERNNNVNPEKFHDFYESNGWKVGKNAMKDWKAAIRNWEKSENPPSSGRTPLTTMQHNIELSKQMGILKEKTYYEPIQIQITDEQD